MKYAMMIVYGEMLGLGVGQIAERLMQAHLDHAPWTAVCKHESKEEYITVGYVYPLELRDRIIRRSEEINPHVKSEAGAGCANGQ